MSTGEQKIVVYIHAIEYLNHKGSYNLIQHQWIWKEYIKERLPLQRSHNVWIHSYVMSWTGTSEETEDRLVVVKG